MTGPSVDNNPPLISGSPLLQCGNRRLDLSVVRVMGILNTTPDSFSDGGQLLSGGFLDLDLALRRAEQMLQQGAAIIDIGGESTRPGAATVTPQQEMDRVLPVVEAIAGRFDTVISVDTSCAELIRAAAGLGAGLINDVRALERDGALAAAVDSGLPVCLMHMQGQPDTMQRSPGYQDVVAEVIDYLTARARIAMEAGLPQSSILLDPGFGFGKTVDHNLQLLNQLPRLTRVGFPVLVGLSRKSLIGKVLGRDVHQRLAASLSLAVIAAQRGASIVRCHDVGETVDALAMLECVRQEKNVGRE